MNDPKMCKYCGHSPCDGDLTCLFAWMDEEGVKPVSDEELDRFLEENP